MSKQDAKKPQANIFASPGLVFGLWNPFLIGISQFNGHAMEGFGTIFSEWQNFVGRRLTQNMLLMQQLAKSQSPENISEAFAEFWQNAFADYTKEIETLNKLVAGVSSKAVSKAQSASQDAANIVSRAMAAE